MRFSSVALTALVPTLALAETFTVKVGEGGLKFTPETLRAAVDDIVTFEFYPKNHTVTQSLFNTPCTQAVDAATGQRGVDSGFVPVNATTTPQPKYSIKIVNADAPLWFYCAQGNHCTQGMVFSINPSAEKTHEQFVANARGGGGAAPPQGSPPPGGPPPASSGGPSPTGGAPNPPPPGSGPSNTGINGPINTAVPPPPNDPAADQDPESSNNGSAPPNNNSGIRVGGSSAALTLAALIAGVFLL